MSNAAVQDEAEDRYYTQVDAGDVRLFTLDQLDAAFNAGLIHENTYVCLEGSSDWLTLGEVAGLSDEEEPVSAPQLIAQHVSYQAHHAFAAPSSTSAPYSVAPMVAPSLRPVVNDLALDDDFEMMAMRPKRRIGKVLAGIAVLGLAGLGFAVVQSGGLRLPKLALGAQSGQTAAASLSLSSLKDSPTTPAAVVPTPAPEAAKPEPPAAEATKPAEPAAATTEKADAKTDEAKKADDRFSEEMKAALLNKDKKQATDQKHKKAARGAVAAKASKATKAAKSSKAAAGFKSGGSAYDPLNGKL